MTELVQNQTRSYPTGRHTFTSANPHPPKSNITASPRPVSTLWPTKLVNWAGPESK